MFARGEDRGADGATAPEAVRSELGPLAAASGGVCLLRPLGWWFLRARRAVYTRPGPGVVDAHAKLTTGNPYECFLELKHEDLTQKSSDCSGQ